ncbi:serine O-acetyltransferase [Pseudonocardia sp.]|uniref:serine O-acetyltransferase n=1 Tax=Pseudonocardia sp. TaxID=60912 RepID=UPI003D0A9FE2
MVHARRAAVAALLRELARPQAGEIRAVLDGWTADAPATVDAAEADLLAFAHRDPAAHGSWWEVLGSYRCYRAVAAHRVAHAVLQAPLRPGLRTPAGRVRRRTIARAVSEHAKVDTGVEIHPGASIGARFVVDHGTGTVIGETAVVGDDCYLLHGVVLGATGIADLPRTRRHPRLGDRVEIGAFARVLGPVTVGDDVVIGCHALVRHDVAAGSRISVVTRNQSVRMRAS